MTEALDIQKARHSEISPTKREQKRWHRKDILTPALSAAAGISWTSSFFKLQSLQVKLQSCFIWNSPTYSAARHSDKSACTFHRNRSEVYSSKRKLLVAFQTFRCRPRPTLERWGWGGGASEASLSLRGRKVDLKEGVFVSLVKCFPRFLWSTGRAKGWGGGR